jgi:hypothetical protein
MSSGVEGPTGAGPAHDPSDDTIELQLTADEELALSRAAAAAESVPASPVPQYANFVSRRTARVDFVCNVTLAVTGLAIAVAFAWPKPDRHVATPAAASTESLAEVVPLSKTVALPEAPVRITNAFDATEVFEFPYGTSEADAQAAVAAVLLDRAHERRTEGLTLKRGASHQRNHDAPLQPSAVFVTRLLARTKDPLSGTN